MFKIVSVVRPGLGDIGSEICVLSELKAFWDGCKQEDISETVFLQGFKLVLGKTNGFVERLKKEMNAWGRGKTLEHRLEKRYELLSLLVGIVTSLADEKQQNHLELQPQNLSIIYRVVSLGISQIESFQNDSNIPSSIKEYLTPQHVSEFTASLLKSVDKGAFSEKGFGFFSFWQEMIKNIQHPLISASYDYCEKMPNVLDRAYQMLTHLKFWIEEFQDVLGYTQSKSLRNLCVLVPLLTNKEGRVTSSSEFSSIALSVEGDLPSLMTEREFESYLQEIKSEDKGGEITLDIIRAKVLKDCSEFLDFFDSYVDTWQQCLKEYKQVIFDIQADQDQFKSDARVGLQVSGFQIEEAARSLINSKGSFEDDIWNQFHLAILRVLRGVIISDDIHKSPMEWSDSKHINEIERLMSEVHLVSFSGIIQEQLLDALGVLRNQDVRVGYSEVFKTTQSLVWSGQNIAALTKNLKEQKNLNPLVLRLNYGFNNFIEVVYCGKFSEFLIDTYGVSKDLIDIFYAFGIRLDDSEFADSDKFLLKNKVIFESLNSNRFFDILNCKKQIDARFFHGKMPCSEFVQDDVQVLQASLSALEKLLTVILNQESTQRVYTDYYSRMGRSLKLIPKKLDTLSPSQNISLKQDIYCRSLLKSMAMSLLFYT